MSIERSGSTLKKQVARGTLVALGAVGGFTAAAGSASAQTSANNPDISATNHSNLPKSVKQHSAPKHNTTPKHTAGSPTHEFKDSDLNLKINLCAPAFGKVVGEVYGGNPGTCIRTEEDGNGLPERFYNWPVMLPDSEKGDPSTVGFTVMDATHVSVQAKAQLGNKKLFTPQTIYDGKDSGYKQLSSVDGLSCYQGTGPALKNLTTCLTPDGEVFISVVDRGDQDALLKRPTLTGSQELAIIKPAIDAMLHGS